MNTDTTDTTVKTGPIGKGPDLRMPEHDAPCDKVVAKERGSSQAAAHE